METHVKVLGVIYIAFSAFFVLGALFLLLAVGGAAGIVGISADPDDAALAIPIMGIAGSFAATILLVLGLPGLIGGWGLFSYRPWARILVLILSALNLLNFAAFPVSTALGVYGLWVLLNKDSERLFNPAAPVRT
jgi:hypothetical protein